MSKSIETKKTIFPNGITVLSETLPYVRSVSLGIWFNTGSRDEHVQINGISHFFEHMVFKGTNNRTAAEIATTLERVGGHLNAFTGKEQVCLFAHFLDEHFPIAIDVLSDMINSPRFDPADIERERRVIVEEIRNLQDNSEEYVHELLFQALWPGCSLGRSIAGTEKTIKKIGRPQLVRFRKSILSEGQVLVAAAGNIKHSDLCAAVSELLKHTCKHRSKRVRPKPARGARSIIGRDIQQVHISLGFPGYPFTSKKKYALYILNLILGEGMSSRLFQRIREEAGLAYSVFSFNEFFIDTGIAGIYVGTDPARSVECQKMIRDELKKICSEGISKQELAFAKTCLKGNLFLGLESTNNRMHRIARMELYQGFVDTMEATSRAVEGVTCAEVLEVAREIYTPRKLCLSVIAPKKIARERNFDVLLGGETF
jgi:predicted Zn-dependent peptidase